jgi:hypothetical protein
VDLVLLELVNCELALVDRNEVDKFAVLLNVNVCLFDACLEGKNVLFFARFRLEERLESSFTKAELFKLLLVVTLLAFCR